jgi:alpha-beta hydrolase superfamily lysophospholipase
MTHKNNTDVGQRRAECGEIETIRSSDGYLLNVRLFRPESPATAQLFILHGVVSHSDWLRPLASRLAVSGIQVICPDRRGTGLNNEGRGDAPAVDTLLNDVRSISKHFCSPSIASHLSGFCWGASYAIHVANRMPNAFSSLILIAPSLFPSRDIARKTIETGPSGKASEVPLVPLDRFTSGPAYKDYILRDNLRTKAVSPRFNGIMIQMTAMLAPLWARQSIPSLVILAEQDRLADNEKHVKAFKSVRSSRKKLVFVPGEHGVQFDAPDETVRHILEWLSPLNTDRSL